MLLSKEKILCQPITLLSSSSNYEHIKRQLRFVYLKTKDLRKQILLSNNVQKRNKVGMINDYCNLWFTGWLEYTCCPSWRSSQERWESPGSSGSVPVYQVLALEVQVQLASICIHSIFEVQVQVHSLWMCYKTQITTFCWTIKCSWCPP